ncbi:hypothetical protein IFM47457_03453 [Aspergillus lentulus]|nr:hypothetical protein IFM47457_03453 [Aspergillus lentulus]
MEVQRKWSGDDSEEREIIYDDNERQDEKEEELAGRIGHKRTGTGDNIMRLVGEKEGKAGIDQVGVAAVEGKRV